METFLYDKIQRYVFPYIDSNMYILAEDGEALVIDPHISRQADAYLKENEVKKITILLTHEHFDHTCGIPWFREYYETTVICQEETLNERRQKHFCRPLVISVILADRNEMEKVKALESEYSPQTITAERTFAETLEMEWKGHKIFMEHMPGHSPASSLIILDEVCVFTGDSLIPDAEPTVRWPWSDAVAYREKTVSRLLKISQECMIYPGHREPVIKSELIYINERFIKLKEIE